MNRWEDLGPIRSPLPRYRTELSGPGRWARLPAVGVILYTSGQDNLGIVETPEIDWTAASELQLRIADEGRRIFPAELLFDDLVEEFSGVVSFGDLAMLAD